MNDQPNPENATGPTPPESGDPPKKKMSARELMALRKAAEEGDPEAKAALEARSAAPPAEAAPKKKMSARELMALRKAAEEGDPEAKAALEARSATPPAAPVSAPPAEAAPKKKMSARELMALRKAAEEGDAEAKAALEAMKPAPAAAAPAAAPKPAPPAVPFTHDQEAEIQRFRDRFGEAITDQGLAGGMLRLTVAADRLPEIARYCRDQGYNIADNMTAVDLIGEEAFRLVYILASVPAAPGPIETMRVRGNLILHVLVPRHESASVPSVVDIYPSFDWDEREVYDLFGINFEGHPDLRRIMLPDDWEGHPLRKDYTFID